MAHVAQLVLAFLAGFATPYVWHWIDWTVGKRRRSEWSEWS